MKSMSVDDARDALRDAIVSFVEFTVPRLNMQFAKEWAAYFREYSITIGRLYVDLARAVVEEAKQDRDDRTQHVEGL